MTHLCVTVVNNLYCILTESVREAHRERVQDRQRSCNGSVQSFETTSVVGGPQDWRPRPGWRHTVSEWHSASQCTGS